MHASCSFLSHFVQWCLAQDSESIDSPMTFYQTHPSFDKNKKERKRKEREPHMLVHVLKSRFIGNKRKLNVTESLS
jgi:protein involved in sex pheromone biosynthesis